MKIVLDLDKVKKRARKEYNEDGYKKFCEIIEEEYTIYNLQKEKEDRQWFIEQIKECIQENDE